MKAKEFELVVEVLTKENERLQKINDDLMDRIMAGNYTNYQMFKHQPVRDAALEEALSSDSDSDNAGTIYETEE